MTEQEKREAHYSKLEADLLAFYEAYLLFFNQTKWSELTTHNRQVQSTFYIRVNDIMYPYLRIPDGTGRYYVDGTPVANSVSEEPANFKSKSDFKRVKILAESLKKQTKLRRAKKGKIVCIESIHKQLKSPNKKEKKWLFVK
jgi:hypothetical protein